MNPSWLGKILGNGLHCHEMHSFYAICICQVLYLDTLSRSVSSSILSAIDKSWPEVTLVPTIMLSTASNSWVRLSSLTIQCIVNTCSAFYCTSLDMQPSPSRSYIKKANLIFSVVEQILLALGDCRSVSFADWNRARRRKKHRKFTFFQVDLYSMLLLKGRLSFRPDRLYICRLCRRHE